jgi:serine/threonine protein kinase/SAM-dependent methyltransferase
MQDHNTAGTDAERLLPGLCRTPNQNARPPRLEVCPNAVIFHGYQEFAVNQYGLRVLPIDGGLQRKFDMLNGWYTPAVIGGKSVLDLGANAGFFSFLALQRGASKAIAVDMDPEYITLLQRARDSLGLDRLTVVEANIADYTEPADCVVALALIHWIYACTAAMGSLDAAVRQLAALTGEVLFAEWVEATDPAIKEFGHLERVCIEQKGPYTRAAFEAALASHFARVQLIGDVTTTRSLYVAFRTPHERDLTGPLPLLYDRSRVLASRCLTRYRGIDYWSIVYDLGDAIVKQATLDLAAHEGRLLQRLSGSHFPRVLSIEEAGGYSAVRLERIEGEPLALAGPSLAADERAVATLVIECLDLLVELRAAGIEHRDIRPENLLVRNDRPVLIDFGFAVADDAPFFIGHDLGGPWRPPDGSFCDVYTMGRVLEKLVSSNFRSVRDVLALMTQLDPALRVTDPSLLKRILLQVIHPIIITKGSNLMSVNRRKTKSKRPALHARDLIEQIAARDRELNFLRVECERLHRTLTERQDDLKAVNDRLLEAERAIGILRASTNLPRNPDLLEGWVDTIAATDISGWGRDPTDPAAVVFIDVLINNERVATIPCEHPREDLQDLGARAFTIDPRRYLKPGINWVRILFFANQRSVPNGDGTIDWADPGMA